MHVYIIYELYFIIIIAPEVTTYRNTIPIAINRVYVLNSGCQEVYLLFLKLNPVLVDKKDVEQ